MKQKHKRFLALACLTVGIAAPAFAIFGLGDIVFDPTSFGELVQQYLQMEQEYAQLVETYEVIQNQYQQMLFMAQRDPVNMALHYLAAKTPWVNSSATNVYGTSAGWITGITTGSGVASGYQTATQPLGAYGGPLSAIPGSSRIQTDYATVELTDGANLAGMQTLGRLRANAPSVETAIQNVESDSLSSDPNMNTEIAVLNKINAAGVIGLRNTQDTNKLLATLAEEQIIEAKRKRDAEAEAFNDHILFVAQGQSVMAAQTAGASQAMMTWRMP